MKQTNLVLLFSALITLASFYIIPICPAGQIYVTGVGCKCPHNGEIYSNNACVCPNGYLRLDSINCLKCPQFGYWDITLIPQGCSCNYGYKWNSGRTDCVPIGTTPPCPSSQIYVAGQGCQCPSGELLSNGACVCPAGYLRLDGIHCLKCPQFGYWDITLIPQGCSCNYGYKWNSGRTDCVPIGTTPPCPSSQIYVAGQGCQCPSGELLSNGACVCPAGYLRLDGIHCLKCPQFGYWDITLIPQGCSCNYGYKWNSGRTDCVPIGTTPPCPSSQIYVAGQGCQCPSGELLSNGACVCPAGYLRLDGIHCLKCPQFGYWDITLIPQGCSCNYGYQWNSGRTDCVPIGTTPPCPSSQIYVAGQGCQCPSGELLSNGACVCPAGYLRLDGIHCLKCPQFGYWDITLIPQGCSCNYGYQWNSGRTDCVPIGTTPPCPSSQIYVAGQGCQCPSGELLSNGACVCPAGYLRLDGVHCLKCPQFGYWDITLIPQGCSCNYGYKWNSGRTDCVPI